VVLRAQAVCGAVTRAEQELRHSGGLPHLVIAQQRLQRAVRRQDQARDLQVRAGAAVGEPVRVLVEQRLVPRLHRIPHQRVPALQRRVLPGDGVYAFSRPTCQRDTRTAQQATCLQRASTPLIHHSRFFASSHRRAPGRRRSSQCCSSEASAAPEGAPGSGGGPTDSAAARGGIRLAACTVRASIRLPSAFLLRYAGTQNLPMKPRGPAGPACGYGCNTAKSTFERRALCCRARPVRSSIASTDGSARGAMGDAEDGRQGLTEDELVDDAVMDTLIRESVSQTIGDNTFAQARKPVLAPLRWCLPRAGLLPAHVQVWVVSWVVSRWPPVHTG